MGAATTNGVPQMLVKPPPLIVQQPPPVAIAPARVVLKEKPDSKPLQEQLPVTQIKSEPVEYECKMAPPATPTVTNGVVANGGVAPPGVAPAPAPGLPQGMAMVVPTVGLMSPVSINLNDLQSVLKVAMDGSVLRQVLGSANGVVAQGKQGILVQQPQQQIISLPAFVDHDGTTKIIINYSIGPANANAAANANANAGSQPLTLVAKNNLAVATASAAAAPTPSKTDRAGTPEAADLSMVKTEPEALAIEDKAPEQESRKEAAAAARSQTVPKFSSSSSTCVLCDDCPDHMEALHLLQHRKAANGEAVDSAALDPSFADLLSEAGVTLEEPPVDDLLALLRSYFASNANPGEDELAKISESVSIPTEVVRKWFIKMNSGKSTAKRRNNFAISRKTPSAEAANQSGDECRAPSEGSAGASPPPRPSSLSADLVIVKQEPEEPDGLDSQAEPLDLSIPKHLAAALAAKKAAEAPASAKQQEQPLNLTCLRKEQVEGRTLYLAQQPGQLVAAAQLPTLVAIAGGQASVGSVGCLGAINNSAKRTILIPQLTYTYAATGGNNAGAKTVVLNGHKVGRGAVRPLINHSGLIKNLHKSV